MPRETDLLRVKLVAHTLLDVQIQETALSPVIVSHPFTNSGISALRNEDGSLSMVDLINNSDDCTRWRRKVGEQIDSAENVHQLFVLLNIFQIIVHLKIRTRRFVEQHPASAAKHLYISLIVEREARQHLFPKCFFAAHPCHEAVYTICASPFCQRSAYPRTRGIPRPACSCSTSRISLYPVFSAASLWIYIDTSDQLYVSVCQMFATRYRM